jgi:hypothetical protein
MHRHLSMSADLSLEKPVRASRRLSFYLFVLSSGVPLRPHLTRYCCDTMADDSNPDPDRPDLNFSDLWTDALRRYLADTGRDLSQISHFDSLINASTVEEVCIVLQGKEESFKTFRAHGEKIRKVLAPVVRLVRLFVDAGAETASYFVRPLSRLAPVFV